ncbi:hypothetical protein QYE76_042792 [Lolium multiflorum]|uniref:Uncharacterized protein n=1 Tax=Lolium multiflorum TaxID=4521 RepID=A0AAD8THN4_LOLMU|nr:hypothetical protein QYE76_042792 [Lolium multiflorum]
MKAEILEEVKKEIEKMLNAGFIRPCRYAEWISSIVPVEKKDGRWRVAIDFRDLNRATPKDEYPMPVAETLINAAAGHKGRPALAVAGPLSRVAGDIFVAGCRRGGFFFVSCRHPPTRRGSAAGGYSSEEVSSSAPSFLLVGGDVLAQSVVVALFLQILVDEKMEVVLPVKTRRPPTEKSQSLSSHHSGARASYAAIGSYSGADSLEEEDWKERPEEAEEESMVAEEVFSDC